jgi:hypothetical protein
MSKKHSQISKARRGFSPAVILLGDKLKVLSVAFVGGAIVIWLFILSCIKQQSFALNKQLEKWKVSYHLTDEQMSQLRAIELSFHGNGNPFSDFAIHTAEETFKHHQYMSTLMSPEDGARFLADLKKTPRSY